MRTPRKCFRQDQIRALLVGAVLLPVLLSALAWLRIPEDIESKMQQALEQQGG